MRNAAANFDDDFDLREPVRKKTARRATSGAKRKKGKTRFGFNIDMKRVARYGAIGMSVTVVFGIMVNALMLQKGHHPAPLFGSAIPLGDSALVGVRAAARKADAEKPAPMPVAKPTVPTEAPEPAAVPAAPTSDAIAHLLQTGAVPPQKTETKTVVAAQRALTKLGFAVKATGTFGPQTKKALESFQKARHLPVNGELSRRVIKALATESGLKIEH